MVKQIKAVLKKNITVRRIQLCWIRLCIFLLGERKWTEQIYAKEMGTRPNLEHPMTLNEKTVWLKLNYFQPFYLQCCDKYKIHDFLRERLGEDYAPKLLYVTKDPKELSVSKIQQFPCIIKVSNGSGSNLIVNSKEQYSDPYLQKFFKLQMIRANVHTATSREHQYLEKDAYIVVEELLQQPEGGLPNDYKFLCINGELQFIYCSIDRLGSNVRHVYDEHWNRLHFIWVKNADKELFDRYDNSPSIKAPQNFEKMKQLAKELAKDFPLVRVDFYEVGTQLYIGEITLHHGSGSDKFYPEKYDLIYGEKLSLPPQNRQSR